MALCHRKIFGQYFVRNRVSRKGVLIENDYSKEKQEFFYVTIALRACNNQRKANRIKTRLKKGK